MYPTEEQIKKVAESLIVAFGGRSQVPSVAVALSITGNINNQGWRAPIPALVEVVWEKIFGEDDLGGDADEREKIVKMVREQLKILGI